MAGLEIFVEGARKIAEQLRKRGEEYDREVRKIINAGALAIHADATRSVLRGPKTGIVYTLYDPEGHKRVHQASAPGEAPATDQGDLARGITIVTDEDGKGASIVSKADYSWFLEMGTVDMAARPFMMPALDKNTPEIVRRLKNLTRGSSE